MICAHAIKENGQRVMLSEFALYWDMLSSIDLRTNREKKLQKLHALHPFKVNTLNQQGAKLYVRNIL